MPASPDLFGFAAGATGPFAPSPIFFEDSSNVVNLAGYSKRRRFEVSPQYVEMDALLADRGHCSLLLLNCADSTVPDAFSRCVLVLRQQRDDVYERVHETMLRFIDKDEARRGLIRHRKALLSFNEESDFHLTTIRISEPVTMNETLFVRAGRCYPRAQDSLRKLAPQCRKQVEARAARFSYMESVGRPAQKQTSVT